MPLDPVARAILDQLAERPPLYKLSVEVAREQLIGFAESMPPGDPVEWVEDRLIPGADAGGDIPVRIYRPDGEGPLPVTVYFHGGGWTIGNLDTDDAVCRAIANATPSILVSVDYRLAPEHKFPAAVNDACAALAWVAGHAKEFGGDAARLTVAGTSAGANLAAVACLIARDREFPNITAQALMVPVTDYCFDTDSYRENGSGYGLERASMEWFWDNYLNSAAEGASELASPLRARSLAGLPPALVITAGFDPLRTEGEAYARRLAAEGVPSRYLCLQAMMHLYLGPEATATVADHLRSAFPQ